MQTHCVADGPDHCWKHHGAARHDIACGKQSLQAGGAMTREGARGACWAFLPLKTMILPLMTMRQSVATDLHLEMR